MKLSLWQQFSSNHSAHFTVVGTFESPEKANEAANELRVILRRISSWWDNLTPEKRMQWGNQTETATLTPPEIELSQQYRVNWPFSINWYHWEWDRELDPVLAFDHFVIVENPHPHIWHGPQPFDELMAQFGAIIAIDVDESKTFPDQRLFLNVVCKLPQDSMSAAILYEGFREDFAIYREKGWDDDYNPNIKFHFNSDIATMKFTSDIRVYEVSREGDYLYLHGINITEVDSLSESLPKFIDYLTQEGCTEIQFSFQSVPIASWGN